MQESLSIQSDNNLRDLAVFRQFERAEKTAKPKGAWNRVAATQASVSSTALSLRLKLKMAAVRRSLLGSDMQILNKSREKWSAVSGICQIP